MCWHVQQTACMRVSSNNCRPGCFGALLFRQSLRMCIVQSYCWTAHVLLFAQRVGLCLVHHMTEYVHTA